MSSSDDNGGCGCMLILVVLLLVFGPSMCGEEHCKIEGMKAGRSAADIARICP